MTIVGQAIVSRQQCCEEFEESTIKKDEWPGVFDKHRADVMIS